MSESTKVNETLLGTPKRKAWKTPKLETVNVAERTNKKTVNPSDGLGAHTLS